MSNWVTTTIHIDVNHHLRRIDPEGHAVAECGTHLLRYNLGPFPEVAECRSCAEHVYARDNRRTCAHCHKIPRRAA
jgi:hypothetical protein